jgi:oligosaccharide repeat unit polymerase
VAGHIRQNFADLSSAAVVSATTFDSQSATAGAAILIAALVAAWLIVAGHALTLLALLVCGVAAVPIFLAGARVDLFSPWNYLFYFVVLNVLVRSVLIDFDLAGDGVDLNGTFFLDQPPEFLVESMGLMLFGFLFVVLGYLLPPNVPAPVRWRIFHGPIDARRVNLLLAAMLVISAGAFAVFVAVTFEGVGDFAWRLLSSHRGLSDELTEYRGYGYLRMLTGLSNCVVYVSYLMLRSARSNRGKYRAALAAGLLITLAMAFYTQSRAALVFAFLNILFIKYYLDGRRFPWRIFAVLAPLIVVLFIVTSSLRAGAGVDLSERVTPMTIVAPIILTNNGIDASKTGHIVDYVDDTQDFKLGQTLVQFLLAPVPRELWHDKPPNLDTYVGEKIYGAETFGAAAVPASFFGEMYLNFWYAGIVMGALLLGVLLKKINNLLVTNAGSGVFVVCYVVLLQSIGMSVLGSGVSSTMIGVLSTGLPLVLAFLLVVPAVPSAGRA